MGEFIIPADQKSKHDPQNKRTRRTARHELVAHAAGFKAAIDAAGRKAGIICAAHGGIAQLVERTVRIRKARGSNPLTSTIQILRVTFRVHFPPPEALLLQQLRPVLVRVAMQDESTYRSTLLTSCAEDGRDQPSYGAIPALFLRRLLTKASSRQELSGLIRCPSTAMIALRGTSGTSGRCTICGFRQMQMSMARATDH